MVHVYKQTVGIPNGTNCASLVPPPPIGGRFVLVLDKS